MLPSNPNTFGAVREMTPFPEWVRELAFQLWAWECSQNTAKVALLLSTGTYTDNGGFVPEDAMLELVSEDGEVTLTNPPIHITRQAVHKWSQSENWKSRRVEFLRDFAPDIHATVAGNLAADALAAEALIADILAGRIVPKDSTEAKTLDVRFKAAQDVLSRAGHLPHNRPKDDGALPAPTVNHSRSIAGMTREERLELAWGRATTTRTPTGTMQEGSESFVEATSP